MKNNSTDPKKMILDILEIIDYEGDKQKYADDLVMKFTLKPLSDMINRLPVSEREELNSALEGEKDPKKIWEILIKKFSEKQYFDEVKKSSGVMFTDFIKTLEPTLSDEQKNKLRVYLKDMIPPATT
jgi:hypothetical protein